MPSVRRIWMPARANDPDEKEFSLPMDLNPRLGGLRRLCAAACAAMTLALCACSDVDTTDAAMDAASVDDSRYVFSVAADGAVPNGQGASIAFVADYMGVETGPDAAVWRGVQTFASSFQYEATLFEAASDSQDSREAALRAAAESGTGLVVCRGDQMAAALYEIQYNYPTVNYLMLDGEPHTQDYTSYTTADTTTCVLFSEEQAGYLAGYAAVMEGFNQLGFVGAEAMPDTVSYCNGYLQGIEAAAQVQGVQASVNVWYVGGHEAGETISSHVEGWYDNGVQAVMAVGENVLESVLPAAQEAGAWVIGADWDSTSLDDHVLTAALKNYSVTVQKQLYRYFTRGGWGDNAGTSVRVGVSENAVSLPASAWRFANFDRTAYEKEYARLYSAEVKVERYSDTDTLPATPSVAVDLLG